MTSKRLGEDLILKLRLKVELHLRGHSMLNSMCSQIQLSHFASLFLYQNREEAKRLQCKQPAYVQNVNNYIFPEFSTQLEQLNFPPPLFLLKRDAKRGLSYVCSYVSLLCECLEFKCLLSPTTRLKHSFTCTMFASNPSPKSSLFYTVNYGKLQDTTEIGIFKWVSTVSYLRSLLRK